MANPVSLSGVSPGAAQAAGLAWAPTPGVPAAAPAVSDEQLFVRARAGERECLAVLVQRYEAPLFSLLVRLTHGDAATAEDLFQETFLRVLRAADRFAAGKAFRPWLIAIALNLVRDRARRTKSARTTPFSETRADGRDERLLDREDGPLDCAERNEEAERLRAALARLTEKEREVVLLHFYQRMTLEEAAAALDVPLGTAKSRLNAALVRLREVLKGLDGGAKGSE